jgi:hypothetical protein
VCGLFLPHIVSGSAKQGTLCIHHDLPTTNLGVTSQALLPNSLRHTALKRKLIQHSQNASLTRDAACNPSVFRPFYDAINYGHWQPWTALSALDIVFGVADSQRESSSDSNASIRHRQHNL